MCKIILVLIVAAIGVGIYFFSQYHYENTKIENSYDFIVVGAGAAGAVVANRLTENPKVTVLLIEAGLDQNNMKIHIPGAANELINSDVDWKYRIVKRNNSFLGNEGFYPRGKTVGGSTAINWMAYVRGNHEDYNSWRDAGNPGWGFDDVLPYFKKSERTHVPNLDEKYHSKDGLWDVNYPIYQMELAQKWLKAGEEAGFYNNPDYNGAKQEGVSLTQQSITPGGVRTTSANFVYPFLKKRPNFHLVTETQVNRVIFDGTRAIGVEIERNGKISIVKCNKEVIVSAGAINTPKILMLSGVGPANELKKHDIAQIMDLPVGLNLQDHPQFGVEWNVSIDSLNLQQLESYMTAIKYFVSHNNQLAQSLLFGSGFFNTPGNKLKFPDIQIHYLPLSSNCEIYTKFMGAYPNLCNPEYVAKYGMAMVVVLLHEKSRGSVTLASKNANDAPLIDLNFYDDQEDMTTLIKGIRIAQKIANADAFKGINMGLKKVDWNPNTPDSDAYWKMMIEYWGNHLYHPVGTAKMGPKSDKTSVVDSTLKIHGLSGIRVIDASIMPHLVSGNTAAASVMIGEKGADLIKQDYKE